MDRRGQRTKRVVGADVGRRLLAAYVLLAGLHRENEAGPAVHVHGASGDATGHAAQVLLPRREESEARPAEAHRVAERLPLPDDDVGTRLRRWSEHPSKRQVGGDHEQCTRAVRDLAYGGEILEPADEVRIRDDHARGIGHERGQRGHVGEAVANGSHHRLDQTRAGVRAKRAAPLRVHGAGHDHTLAPREVGSEQGGFDHRRGAVVHGGVGYVHASEPAHERLELVDRL